MVTSVQFYIISSLPAPDVKFQDAKSAVNCNSRNGS